MSDIFKDGSVPFPDYDRDDTANALISQVRSTYNGGMFNHTYDDVNPTGRNDYQIYFANGGDRGKGNTPEMDVCREMDIQMIWGMGGNDKPQSSSWLVDKFRENK